jgi:hypothetical protein
VAEKKAAARPGPRADKADGEAEVLLSAIVREQAAS